MTMSTLFIPNDQTEYFYDDNAEDFKVACKSHNYRKRKIVEKRLKHNDEELAKQGEP